MTIIWPVRSVSIRQLLIFATVSQILGAVSIVGYLSFKNGEIAVENLGNQILNATNDHIERELEGYLSAPLTINHLNVDAIKTGLVDINDPIDLEWRLWNQLQAFESVSYIYISSAQGGSVAVGRDAGDSFIIEKSETYPTSGDYTLYDVDEQGRRSQPIQTIQNQDARRRPWFQQPVTAQKQVWTEPFNYVDRESVIAISAAAPLYDLAGSLQGVAAVDLSLAHISRFLRSLTPNAQDQIFIIDRPGRLLATSDSDPVVINEGTAEIIQAANSSNSLIRITTRNLQQQLGGLSRIQQPQRIKMRLEEHTYFVQVNPWKDSIGLDWLVVVMVPESRFLEQIISSNKTTATFCVLAAAAATALATLIASRISRPILELSNASQTLAEASRQNFIDGKISPRLKTSGINEFKTLALSFENMSEQLQTSFAQLEDHSQSLERKVKERTQALEEEIVERQQAQKYLGLSEQKYRTLYEGGQDAILLLDTKSITDCNLAALKMFGCQSMADFEGKTPADFSPVYQPDGRASAKTVRSTVAKAIRSGTYNFEWLHQRKDGEPFYADVWLASMEIEGKRIVQAVIRDITARKQAIAAMAAAKQAAEVANKAKSHFLANMSHELRSPLNAILGFAQILEQSTTVTTEHRESAMIIGRSGEHLLHLINDVLDMSKIEAGRISITPTQFDLYRLLDDLRNMFRLRADEKQLALDFHYAPGLPPYISTDQGKLRQVLINLLGNAVKFTATGSVSLYVNFTQIETEEAEEAETKTKKTEPEKTETEKAETKETKTEAIALQFEVRDTGLGIHKSEINKIFKPFVQTQAGQVASEGTGLGLPISLKFAQLMGGDLTIESTFGRGTTALLTTTVRVVSGLQIGERLPERRVLAIAPHQPQYRLLIVDDKPANRKLLTTLLQPLGFNLKEAANGQAAVDITLEWQPHLVWMDMRMPILDGYMATQQIRRAQSKGHFQTVTPKIVALSASSFREEQNAATESGCDDFIHKPFRTTEIFEAIRKHLGVRYLYETENASDTATTDLPSADTAINTYQLHQLPPQLLTKLEAATERLQWNRIVEIIEQVRLQDESLSKALTSAVDSFQYKKILEAIREKREEGEKTRE